MHYEYFPIEIPQLQKEISDYHPALKKILEEQVNKDIEIQLAEIGLYLNIALDGEYKMPDLCKLFIKQLENKRAIIITNL